MMITKQPQVAPHTHPSTSVVAWRDHGVEHNKNGRDPVTALDGEVLTSGTIDGNRLPAISTTKKGAVPAITPAAESTFLKDTGSFARVVQANVDGLKTTETPQFAGMGIGTAGSANHVNLIEGAIVGVAAGPYQKFNAAAKLLELLGADVNIGDQPTQPGTGGTWATSYDSAAGQILCQAVFLGKLYAGGNNGNIYVFDGSAWSLAYDSTASYVYALCVFNSVLYAAMRKPGDNDGVIAKTSNGVGWTEVAGPVMTDVSTYYPYCFAVYDNKLWMGYYTDSYNRGWIYFSTDGVTWNLSFSTAGCAAIYSLCSFNGKLYAATYIGVKRFDGVSWSEVHTSTSFRCLYVWNNKIYGGTSDGKVFSSSTGSLNDWTEKIDFGTGTVYAFIEYNAKLLAAYDDKIYETVDGTTWTLFYDSAEAVIYSLILYGTALYAGTGTAGKVLSYTDATYIPAPNLKLYGHETLYGQFRPGDSAGQAGDPLVSGGVSYPTYVAKGGVGTYFGGSATLPLFKQIPSTDIQAAATDKLLGRVTAGAGAVEEIACTAAGRALLDDATAAAQATTLGLGTADGPTFAHLHLTDVPATGGALITAAESWIGPSATAGVYFKAGNVGIGTTTPNANAILDVTSTTKAFMPPRMTTTQRDAIASPTEGMVIFNITTHVLNSYYTSWAAV